MRVARSLEAACLAAALVGSALGLSLPAQAEKRSFTIAAIEPKGATTIDKEPFPEAGSIGDGHILRKPDTSGRWEVSAYIWQPSQIVVMQGDEVSLLFVGINGAEHPTRIVGYDKTLLLKRGHVVRVEFKADKAGTFPIICDHHRPTMVGELVVLPKQ